MSAEVLLRDLYGAFGARDVDRILAALHPQVDWPNAIAGTRLRGRDEVGAYWRWQFGEIDPRVVPECFDRRPDGRIAVRVRQTVRDADGTILVDGRIRHVYTLRDGMVARMDIEPDTLAGVERDERDEEPGTPETGASEDAQDLPAEPADDDAAVGDTDEHSGESA